MNGHARGGFGLGLIAISFGIWGIGDIFRGFGQSTVAKVGGTEIRIDQFRQIYQDRLQAISRQVGRPVTSEQARAGTTNSWATIAATRAKWNAFFEEMTAPVNDWLCTNCGAEPGKRILDLACGTGHPALSAARRLRPDGQVVGIDIAPEMVEAMRTLSQRRLAQRQTRSSNPTPSKLPRIGSPWRLKPRLRRPAPRPTLSRRRLAQR